MGLVLVLGLATAGAAWLAHVRSIARSTAIISGIAGLRQENSLKECETVETLTSRQLRSIQDSFVPLMWLGGLAAAVGLVGLAAAGRRGKGEIDQPPRS